MGGLEILERLRMAGAIEAIDLHFARLMLELAGGDDPALALAAALCSRTTGEGHLCLDLREEGGRVVGEPLAAIRLPPAAEWSGRLAGSPVVGAPGEFRPLVLDRAGRLYLHRYWGYEERVAGRLLAASGEAESVDLGRLRGGLGRLFPPSAVVPDWQRVAAATAVLHRFCIISGGPGTGKTTTVVKILALLLEQAAPAGLRIALAAPTGKAAARLQESIRGAREGLAVTPEIRAAIPGQATTLHRLLGGSPDSTTFRHHRDNPLPVDLLLLDEGSMVDIALLAKLLDALPDRARLILLGDRDQLSSVEAGAVLGDLCAGAEGFSEAVRHQLEAICGEPLPPSTGEGTALQDAVVVLRHSYRFSGGGGIGRLAEAVNRGDPTAALAVLADPGEPEVARLGPEQEPAVLAAAGYRGYLELVRRDGAPAEIFAAFDRFRLLCAVREGDSGVAGLNLAVERRLAAADLIAPTDRWYPGRPILVTRNDHALRLYNGDIGILLRDPGGRLQACFPGSDGIPRRIAPSRLPPHETAYAMTVHKSQGSEFAEVLLVLPEIDAPLLTRELLYTAITRARGRFRLHAPGGLLELVIRRRVERRSGLRERLIRPTDSPR